MVTSMVLSNAEKIPMSNSFGFSSLGATAGYLNIGPSLFAGTAGAITDGSVVTNSGLTQSYAIPLIGILNCAKMWPAWLGDLEIELTLNSIANFIAYTTAKSNISAISVSNIEYVTEVLELPPQSYSQLLAANQLSSQNQIIIKSQ